jgi:hypothetical protein
VCTRQVLRNGASFEFKPHQLPKENNPLLIVDLHLMSALKKSYNESLGACSANGFMFGHEVY